MHCVDFGMVASRVTLQPLPGVSFPVANLAGKSFKPLAILAPVVNQFRAVGFTSLLGERGPSATSVVFLVQYVPAVCSYPGAEWSPPMTLANKIRENTGRLLRPVAYAESFRGGPEFRHN